MVLTLAVKQQISWRNKFSSNKSSVHQNGSIGVCSTLLFYFLIVPALLQEINWI